MNLLHLLTAAKSTIVLLKQEITKNAFGYYEFSAGPEAAIAAMNKNSKNTKWKNPDGTIAMNRGIFLIILITFKINKNGLI